jgi:hypothetical protein
MKQVLLISMLFYSVSTNAQTVIDFETPVLPPDSFWNGSDTSLNISGLNGLIFSNFYDTSFFYWTGFALSSSTDTVTGDFTNQYSSISGSGFNSSNQYAVFYLNGFIHNETTEKPEGFYINNSTYAYRDMQNGSSFSKKFGGPTGTDPDYFVLHITGYLNGTQLPDTVSHFLADFRFADNSLDYIQKNWQWVDIYSAFAEADSLSFTLESSDVGSFGMNTPAYFCMDNFTLRDITSIANVFSENESLSVYPNPANDFLQISLNGIPNNRVEILNTDGRLVRSDFVKKEQVLSLNISDLKPGCYIVRLYTEGKVYHTKFLKI